MSAKTLKDRQLIVLKLLCRGYENSQVAYRSHMTESNVERIRKQLMVLSRSGNAVQLGVWAVRNGYTDITARADSVAAHAEQATL